MQLMQYDTLSQYTKRISLLRRKKAEEQAQRRVKLAGQEKSIQGNHIAIYFLQFSKIPIKKSKFPDLSA